MSMTATVPEIAWPEDVLDFAKQNRVESFLQPLHEATQYWFPTATRLEVSLEHDPELPESYIRFEVAVPIQDVPDYVKGYHAWCHDLLRVCPADCQQFFNFGLRRRES